MAQLKPGLAFSIVCDLGSRWGCSLIIFPGRGTWVWIAKPTLDEEPAIEDVEQIDEWRWPVFLPLGTALRRKIVFRIGTMAVPPGLAQFPPLWRQGAPSIGWRLGRFVDGEIRPAGPATDPSIPIYEIVNDISLKEKIVSGWRPEDEW